MSSEITNNSRFSIDEFYNKHKRNINIGAGVLAVLIAGWIYYVKYYMPAQEEEANAELFFTQRYFDKDSMDLVLNGDGKHLGAIDIADEYGRTKAGNLAKYYAGRAYLNKGDYKNAMSYFKKCSFNDEMMAPMVQMLIGDCLVQQDNFEDAAESFMKAGTMRKNTFTGPMALMKAGRAFEKAEKWEKALKAYELIKRDYKETETGNNIEKYIARAKTRAEA